MTPDPNTSLQKYRDANGSHIVIQIAVCFYLLPRRGHTFAKVSRYKWKAYRDTFEKYRGQGSI